MIPIEKQLRREGWTLVLAGIGGAIIFLGGAFLVAHWLVERGTIVRTVSRPVVSLGAPGDPEWQQVQADGNRTTRRLPVPGGHLYTVTEYSRRGAVVGQSAVFVPLPLGGQEGR